MSVAVLPQPKHESQSPSPPPQDQDHIMMSAPPEKPELQVEDIVRLFVLPGGAGSDVGDPSVDGFDIGQMEFDRLAFLGSGAIHMAVTEYCFNQKHIPIEEAEVLRGKYTQPQTWAHWASLYDDFADMGHGLSKNAIEGPRVFKAYAGGVYHQDGIATLQKWIAGLIMHTQANPAPTPIPTEQPKAAALSSDPPSSSSASATLHQSSTGPTKPDPAPTPTPSQIRKREREASAEDDSTPGPSSKRVRILPSAAPAASSSTSALEQAGITVIGPTVGLRPSPPAAAAAPVPSTSTSTPAAAPAAQPSTKKWMSVLNEGCMALKYKPTWREESSGADHAKTWQATLTVPEIQVVESGMGKNKKSAQEEAARRACERLGWTQTYKW